MFEVYMDVMVVISSAKMDHTTHLEVVFKEVRGTTCA